MALAKEAHIIMKPLLPADLAKAVRNHTELSDSQFRGFFPDRQQLHTSLFRLLGCLPSHWNSFYPAQDACMDVLLRFSTQEMREALDAALECGDPACAKGAARLVFTKSSVNPFSAEDFGIVSWMSRLAGVAYADPFPQNRRMVLHGLAEFPDVSAPEVLQAAVGDPDATVRSRAITALGRRLDAGSRMTLQWVASGNSLPRTVDQETSTDYGEGARHIFHIFGMHEDKVRISDKEAAIKAIELQETNGFKY